MPENSPTKTVAITGALSYTGKYATRLLLDRGYRVQTLTIHPDRENPFGDRVEIFPYHFEDPDTLSQILRGTSTLINTYWVRFPRGRVYFRKCRSKHSHADHCRKKRRRETHRARQHREPIDGLSSGVLSRQG